MRMRGCTFFTFLFCVLHMHAAHAQSGVVTQNQTGSATQNARMGSASQARANQTQNGPRPADATPTYTYGSIAGSHVYLFAAGTAGYGTGGISLLHGSSVTIDPSGNGYVTSDGGGGFNISGLYQSYCPTPTANVYLVALGGDSGYGENDDIGLLSAMPVGCNDLPSVQSVSINDLTTVAAAYGLNAFFNAGSNGISSSSSDVSAVSNAFGFTNSLVNGLSGGEQADQTTNEYMNTLANAIMTCVGTSDQSTCQTLYQAATTQSGNSPTNTIEAAMNLVSASQGNEAAVYNLASLFPYRQPMLGAAPASFAMPFPGVPPQQNSPVITGLSVNAAAEGTQIIINGNGFGPAPGTVLFEGIYAPVAAANWSNVQITVTVPVGALTGLVTVVANNQASNGWPFVVFPTILALSHNSGMPTMGFLIEGRNLGVGGNNGNVSLSGTALPVIAAGKAPLIGGGPTVSTLTVQVPQNANGANLQVTTAGPSNVVQFNIIAPLQCP